MNNPIRVNATFGPSHSNFPAYDIHVDVVVGNNIFACKDRVSMEEVNRHTGVLAFAIKHTCDALLRYAEKEFNAKAKKRVKYEELPDVAFSGWSSSAIGYGFDYCDWFKHGRSCERTMTPIVGHGHCEREWRNMKLMYFEDDHVIFDIRKPT